MLVFLNQLKEDDPVLIDAFNIKECVPDEMENSEGEVVRCTLIHLYKGDPWVVRQPVSEVHELVNKARLSARG